METFYASFASAGTRTAVQGSVVPFVAAYGCHSSEKASTVRLPRDMSPQNVESRLTFSHCSLRKFIYARACAVMRVTIDLRHCRRARHCANRCSLVWL